MLNTTHYIILGEVAGNEDPTFWNNTDGWINNLDKASQFNKDVLSTSPPGGTTGIMTIGSNGVPMSTYEFIPTSPGGSPFFFHIPH